MLPIEPETVGPESTPPKVRRMAIGDFFRLHRKERQKKEDAAGSRTTLQACDGVSNTPFYIEVNPPVSIVVDFDHSR